MSDNALPLAIVGGGPTGLACALLLARRGLASVVIEPRALADAQNDRRLLALARGSWDALRPLLGPAAPPTAPIAEVHVSSAGEFGVTRLAASDHGGQPLGATVHYGDLVAALDAAAMASTPIELARGRRVVALAQKPERVTIALDGGGTLDAGLAIHAEGTASAANEDDAALPWALIGEVVLAGPPAGTAFERFTRDGPLALLPAPSDRGPLWSLVWCADRATVQRRLASGAGEFTTELQAALGPRLARVASVVGPRSAYPLRSRTRAALVEHRAVWLGNAAQTLHPVAGQGFNLGLRDAVVLADALAAHADATEALRVYAQRRRADRAAITAATRWLPQIFATRAAPIAAVRMLGLAALDLMPPARRGLAELLMFGVR
ncbi:MAG: FAD-dependent monooxygenase [Betaproteobacteria bacterium]